LTLRRLTLKYTPLELYAFEALELLCTRDIIRNTRNTMAGVEPFEAASRFTAIHVGVT